jgi:hypothetical protein
VFLRTPLAPAQEPRYVAVDAAVGVSAGRGGSFVDRGGGAARIAASGVVPITGNAGLFVALSYDWSGFVGLRGETCVVELGNPSGGCLPPFPTARGINLTLGGAFALATAVELRAGLGAGVYNVDHTSSGAFSAQAEATVFPVPYLGLVASARSVALSRYHQDRLSVAQWLVGVRLRRSASRP